MDYFLEERNLVRAGNPHLADLETDAFRKVTISTIVNDAIEQQREDIARLERRREKVLLDITAEYRQELPIQVSAWNQRQEEISLQRKQIKAELESLEDEEQRRLASIQVQLESLIKRDKKAIQAIKAAKNNLTS